MCGDTSDRLCLTACSEKLPLKRYSECLIDLRYGADPEARRLARDVYEVTHVLPAVTSVGTMIEGYRGEIVELVPALPIGESYRHHLVWVRASLEQVSAFLQWIAGHAVGASRDVAFESRPTAFVFFRTPTPTYPSAFVLDGNIGYNLEGPLHTNAREMHETLFHELFHLNDAKHGVWSEGTLTPIFESIVERCGGDDSCLQPFAPHHSMVPNGTYYPFDERTRDVREYAAEIALRYYLEHEAIHESREPLAPWKCAADENQSAWDAVVDEFFGGVDLTAKCGS